MSGVRSQKPSSGVIAFTALYLLAAGAGAVATGNREFIFYTVVMLLLVAVAAALHFRVGLSRGVLWGLSLWGLVHLAGGLVPVPDSWPINGETRVLYSWWIIPELLKYDHVVHAYGFGVATFVCWEGLQSILASQQNDSRRIKPTPGMLTLCAAAALGLGAVNEIIEFAATLLVPETNVGGYENTGWDLVSNAVGAIAAAAIIAANFRRRSKPRRFRPSI